MKRSYSQNCALAHALDLIGDRWTLLLVRELMIKACRFGELLGNLEGMGTNLLTDRLRQLVDADLVEKTGQHYALTAVGEHLEPVVHELVRFGLTLDVKSRKDRLSRPEWDVVALQALYKPEADELMPGNYELVLDDQAFCIEKTGEGVRVKYEPAENAVVSVKLSKKAARSLAGALSTLEIEAKNKSVAIAGNRKEAARLLRCFGLLA